MNVSVKHSLTIKNISFGGCSIILVGDLAQLPPVMYIPLYAGSSHGTALWCNFNTIVTLSTVFRQQGNDPSQVTFKNLLTNIRNATTTIEDWKILVSMTDSFLSKDK